MDGHALFAMHDLDQIDIGLVEPGVGPGHDGRHGRQGFEVFLINESQLVAVHRIGADAQTQGIEHGVAVRIGPLNHRTFEFHQLLIIHFTGDLSS